MNEKNNESPMVLTILDATVQPDRWAQLENAYNGMAVKLPPQMNHTWLAQDFFDKTKWRAIVLWRNQEAFLEYKNSVPIPEGILLFRGVGAEPTLSKYDIVAEHHNARAEAPSGAGSDSERSSERNPTMVSKQIT